MLLKINYLEPVGAKATDAMFGGNNMFRHNTISAPESTFDSSVQLLQVKGLRYPGGTLSEVEFDVKNPDGPPLVSSDDMSYVGLSDFLNYCAQSGCAPTIVVPTSHLYTGEPDGESKNPREIQEGYISDLVQFVRALLTIGDTGQGALPDVPIAALEIGNEYWGSGNMTAREYGQVVNTLVPILTDLFSQIDLEEGKAPKILVQMGGPWDVQYSSGIHSELNWADRVKQSNLDIISEISSPDAISGISGLVEHYYYGMTSVTLGQDSQSNCFIDSDIDLWSDAGFDNLDIVITEWGVKQSNAVEYGLRGASVLIEQMEHMLKMGVDAAFVWPVQGWKTTLAGLPGADPVLTPMGAAFLAMAESLPGLHVMETGISGEAVEVNAFGSKSKLVIFVMSRSEQGQFVDLDISKFAPDFRGLKGLLIGVEDQFHTDAPNSIATLTELGREDFGTGNLIEFDLGSFEVMRLEFDLEVRRSFSGSDAADLIQGRPSEDRVIGRLGDDTLFGGGSADKVLGNDGDDSLSGGLGGDVVRGGAGSDIANGGGGGDMIYGSSGGDVLGGNGGSDLICGGGGSDHLSGNAGSDYLEGMGGADTLFGGRGSNEMYGGAGHDYIFSGLGNCQMYGGEGSDQFIFDEVSGSGDRLDRIGDFESGCDKIVLAGFTFSVLGDLLVGNGFRVNRTGQSEAAGDRLILDADSGILWFDADGWGGLNREAVCMFDLSKLPTAGDFVFLHQELL